MMMRNQLRAKIYQNKRLNSDFSGILITFVGNACFTSDGLDSSVGFSDAWTEDS